MRFHLQSRVITLAVLPLSLGLVAVLSGVSLAESEAAPEVAAARIAAVADDVSQPAVRLVNSHEAGELEPTPANPLTLRDPRIQRLPDPKGAVAVPTRVFVKSTARTPKSETPVRLANRRACNDALDSPAGPLSGQFDFEQPMDVISSETQTGWQTPPSSFGSISLPPMVEARADQLLREATSLADRGAIYAAQREFLRVMRMVTQSLDSQVGHQTHTLALAAGLRALEEAEDFSLSHGDHVEDDVNLAGYIKGHRTPVLKGADLNQMTSLRAIQRYYEYAREQLTIAAGNTPLGSHALYAMGRAEMFLGTEKPNQTSGAPKSLALFHAALQADPHNARAGNELAVMLARRGRLPEAAGILQQSMQKSPMPVAVSNLAQIFERLGDPRASLVRQRAVELSGGNLAVTQAPDARITWVDPGSFDAAADGPAINATGGNLPSHVAATPSNARAIETIRTAQQGPANRPPNPAPVSSQWW